jgi:hypothetical protein
MSQGSAKALQTLCDGPGLGGHLSTSVVVNGKQKHEDLHILCYVAARAGSTEWSQYMYVISGYLLYDLLNRVVTLPY